MTKYIALLRGINVGGKNKIKMVDLKECFEKNNYKDVKTYIQSGNVTFSYKQAPIETLEKKIENMLSSKFGYAATVIVFKNSVFRKIIKNAPPKFGSEPKKFKYDVIYMKPGQNPQEIAGKIPLKEGVDKIFIGTKVIYFRRLASKLSKSKLSRIVGTSLYKHISIRNWRTSTKLLNLLE